MSMNRKLFQNGLKPVWNQNFDPGMQKDVIVDEWTPVESCIIANGENSDTFVCSFGH